MEDRVKILIKGGSDLMKTEIWEACLGLAAKYDGVRIRVVPMLSKTEFDLSPSCINVYVPCGEFPSVPVSASLSEEEGSVEIPVILPPSADERPIRANEELPEKIELVATPTYTIGFVYGSAIVLFVKALSVLADNQKAIDVCKRDIQSLISTAYKKVVMPKSHKELTLGRGRTAVRMKFGDLKEKMKEVVERRKVKIRDELRDTATKIRTTETTLVSLKSQESSLNEELEMVDNYLGKPVHLRALKERRVLLNLLNGKQWSSIDFLNDGVVAISTFVTILYDGCEFPTGVFRVDIPYDAETTSDICFKLIEGETRGGYLHPHVSGRGHACFGHEGSDIIDDLLRARKYAQVLVMVGDMLWGYNPGDRFHSIKNWNPEAQIYDGEDDRDEDDENPCEDCDEYGSPYCVHECEYRDGGGCDDCYHRQSGDRDDLRFCIEDCPHFNDDPCELCGDSPLWDCFVDCPVNRDFERRHPCEVCDLAESVENCIEDCEFNCEDWALKSPCEFCSHSGVGVYCILECEYNRGESSSGPARPWTLFNPCLQCSHLHDDRLDHCVKYCEYNKCLDLQDCKSKCQMGECDDSCPLKPYREEALARAREREQGADDDDEPDDGTQEGNAVAAATAAAAAEQEG